MLKDTAAGEVSHPKTSWELPGGGPSWKPLAGWPLTTGVRVMTFVAVGAALDCGATCGVAVTVLLAVVGDGEMIAVVTAAVEG